MFKAMPPPFRTQRTQLKEFGEILLDDPLWHVHVQQFLTKTINKGHSKRKQSAAFGDGSGNLNQIDKLSISPMHKTTGNQQ